MSKIVKGTSRSGVGTTLVVPQHRLVFDMGAPLVESLGVRKVFITHGHMDHAGALVFHASTRGMMGMGPPLFHVPAWMEADLRVILKAAARLNGGGVQFDMVPMEAGKSHDLGGPRRVVPFYTDHRLPCLGYKVYQTRNKLRDEFIGLPGEEIGRLRKGGTEVTREVEALAHTHVGDSRVTVLDKHPEVFQSDVLVLECTFVGDYSLEETHRRGHTHLSELAERAELFKDVKAVVLTHFSMRHSEKEVKAEVAKLPESLRDKIHLVF